MKEYKVLMTCMAKGEEIEKDSIVPLDDDTANKLLHLSPPRIAVYEGKKADAPKKKQKRVVKDFEKR